MGGLVQGHVICLGSRRKNHATCAELAICGILGSCINPYIDRANIPGRLWHKQHANDEEHAWDKLHGERCDPLVRVAGHVSLNAITDPEAYTCSSLHANLIDADKSTSDRGRRQFGDIERDNSTSEANTLH
jgi:hypothetical protein